MPNIGDRSPKMLSAVMTLSVILLLSIVISCYETQGVNASQGKVIIYNYKLKLIVSLKY